MLDSVRDEWCEKSEIITNGVMAVDATNEFYRLWSGLQFVCCLPTGQGELSNLELFGDGLLWCAATIIHFMGQQQRFEVFDFSYHILNVEESALVQCTNPNIHQFFKKVAAIRDTNQSIFNTLKAFSSAPPEELVLFHPPKTDKVEQQFIISGDSSGNIPTKTSFPTQPPPPPRTNPPVPQQKLPPPPQSLPQNNQEEDLPPPIEDLPLYED